MRTSSYVIYVDLPRENDQMLLVHGYTGAYDKVSKRVATFVRSLELHKAPKPLYGDWASEPAIGGRVEQPSEETIATLRRRGYLTEMSAEVEEEFVKKIAHKLHDRHLKQAPGYLLMPTYNCNLRCPYCFQDHMRTNPLFQHLLRSMSVSMVDRIMAGVRNIESKYGIPPDTKHVRTWGLFGGEPLLASSRLIIEYIMKCAKAMGPASFSCVTNATELEVYEDLLSPEGISQLQITLDGVPSEHDKRRIYPDGSGSWEKIARNISMALKRGAYVSIRLNVDRQNIETLPALAEIYEQQGWTMSPYFSSYVAPIHAGNGKIDHGTTLDSWQLDRAIKGLKARSPRMASIHGPDDGLKQQARDFFAAPGERQASLLKESFCSAHTGMYIFDAFGDIYACWEKTGDSNIRIGHVFEGGSVEMRGEAESRWRTRTVASNPVCAKCRYAFQCGGGCAVLAAGKTGQYHANFCDGYGSRFRANLAEAYMEHVSGAAMNRVAARVCDQ